MKEENITKNIVVKNDNIKILKQHFSNCFDKNGDFDFEKLKKELAQKDVDFSKENYSMDWLGKNYARLLASDSAKTLLQEDEEWNEKPENQNSQNLLISGDNLEVLKHLASAYREKIKMIYIDPPYNTGSDGFVYQDDRKFSAKELSELSGIDEKEAKRVLTFVDSKSNSHSAWLTFMYPRLYIARQLLRDDGVIFVSIDDNEVAQLRILMDEIFGEGEFVKDIIVNTSEGGGQAKFVINGHDNLLIYAKNLSKFDNLKKPKDIRGKIIEVDGESYWIQEDAIRKEFGKYGNLHYEEILEFKDKKFKDKIDDGLKNNEYILVKKEYGKNIIGKLRKLSDDFSKFHSILKIDRIAKHLTSNGIREIEDIFSVSKGNSPFENPKPVDLLKKVVLSSTFAKKNNGLILDFFAGSGTTGDAVMQLNAQDGGNRKFILAQLPEPIDAKKSKTAYDFVKNELKTENPTIFDITKERIVRSAKKIKENQEKDKNLFENGERNLDFGFKIFKTTPIWQNYEIKAKEFKENLNLFDENQLSDEDLRALLTTWKTYDGIALTQNLDEIDLNGYKSHYFGDRIYLIYKNFATKHLKALIEKIDEDKNFNPKSIIIFGYNFESKLLRELSENLANYNSKKGLEIDFITRY